MIREARPLPSDVQHWRRRRLAFAPKTVTPSKAGYDAFKRDAWLRDMRAKPRIKDPLFGMRNQADWMSY